MTPGRIRGRTSGAPPDAGPARTGGGDGQGAIEEFPVQHIAMVGNGPIEDDIADAVDGADHVVRFNRTRGFGGATGMRVDDLFLINCGGQMHEWLCDAGFWRSAAVRAARRVSLPVAAGHPGSGLAAWAASAPADRHGVNFEHDVRARLGGRVRTMPDGLRRAAIADLAALGAAPRRPVWPSTGFLAVFWYDRTAAPGARIALHGFGLTGWHGHDWARERAWLKQRMRDGRVVPGCARTEAAMEAAR